MALAEVFEAFVGPDAPVEFAAYDGSHAGAAGSPVKITVRSPVAVAYLAQAPGRARAGPRLRGRPPGRRRRHVRRAGPAGEGPVDRAWTSPSKLRLLQALGGPKLLLHRIPPPPQEVRLHRRWLGGRLHSKGRDAQAISHHYDVSNRFYEWVLGPSMAYTCACYPTRGRHAGRGPGQQVRPGGPQARPARRGCGCSTSAAAGAAWSCTPHGSTASRPSASRCPRSRPPGPRRRSSERACPAWPRSATWTTGTCRRPASTRSAPSGSPSTSASRSSRLLLVPVRQAQARRAAAQPLHHPAGQHRAAHPQERLHQPVRVPRRGARRTRLPDLAHARRRLRGAARGEPARALRQDTGRLVRQPGRALGRGGQGGRPGHGPGVAAVHGRLAARLRPQPHRTAPGAGRTGCRPTGLPACRCGPTGTSRRS